MMAKGESDGERLDCRFRWRADVYRIEIKRAILVNYRSTLLPVSSPYILT